MVLFSVGPRKARRRSSLVLVLLALILFAQLSLAQRTSADRDSATTSADDAKTTDATSTTDDATTTGDKTTTTKSRTRDSSATTTTDSKSTSTESSSSSSSSSTSNHPVVTVPPTSDAPYMQKSDTPEGTVFIAVGAALGFIGLSVLAWRGLVAWSVNRSVRQAAIAHSSETKGLLHNKRRKRSSHTHGAPAVSLEKMSGKHRSSHSHRRSSKFPSSNSGLFFSPTAGMHSGGNRASSYLPAGYYAAGNATAGGGQSMPLSSSDLPGMGPQSQGYSRTRSGPSPPGTPPPHHSSGAHEPHHYNTGRQSYAGASTSSVNVSSPTPGRTPSAYLEDLFENPPPQRRQ